MKNNLKTKEELAEDFVLVLAMAKSFAEACHLIGLNTEEGQKNGLYNLWLIKDSLALLKAPPPETELLTKILAKMKDEELVTKKTLAGLSPYIQPAGFGYPEQMKTSYQFFYSFMSSKILTSLVVVVLIVGVIAINKKPEDKKVESGFVDSPVVLTGESLTDIFAILDNEASADEKLLADLAEESTLIEGESQVLNELNQAYETSSF